jgi:nitroreductase
VDAWLVLAAVAVAGWYAHPVVWVGLAPILIGYYVVFAPRQGLAWHLGLFGITAAGLAPNLWWLADWARYWWLRQPSPSDQIPLPEWQAVLGGPGDYVALMGCIPCGALLVAAAAVGLGSLWRSGNRGAAGLLLLALLQSVAGARLLAAWPRVTTDVPDRVIPMAAGLLVVPTAAGLWKVLERGQLAAAGTVLAVVGVLTVGWADGPDRPLAGGIGLRTDPAVVGFSADQQQVIAALRDHTTPEARVLWDETTDHRPGWNWTALLPVLTDRAYIGGLDHDSGVEHSFCEMKDGRLNGRGLDEWTDDELEKFCWWYNVGWVVCRSPAAAERWGRLRMARPVARLKEGGQAIVVYALDRPRSFVLTGSANWEEATATRITLTNVFPDADGWVTLSLHHDEGMRVYPSYINSYVDRNVSTQDPTGRDPINHVRLKVPGPVPRVTLVWENP